ncbi:hypothetical protein BGL68_04270 [Helicobacter pylori]|uniref:Uncharacterized protein n=1 Tax=Helicobacter pylori NQ4076 TaxID=992029 RepID=I9QHI5_HELPX|nr:hypothetical protein HPNQ4076_0263 [Helicobacter pylori NQ4076]OOC32999.1 hypothetical protein BZK24_06590 [Helicobacter pylori]OOP95921.1 hypothetical protein B0X36_04685 [Helicobacter pylori]OPG18287.1 hypothetical protein BFR58_05345 [Helicobacter pylori]OPG39815.1 hypothetical protein BGL68_04270 [Helicobacter pylori]
MDLDKLKDYRALRNAILRLLPYLDSGITELIMNKEKEIWLYKLNGGLCYRLYVLSKNQKCS